jgi:FkbM family methyltransferase
MLNRIMSSERIKENLNRAIISIQKYENSSGSKIPNKLQRIKLLKHRYIIETFLRKCGLRIQLPLKLFWGKKILLPIGDVDSRYLYYFGMLGTAELPLTKFMANNLKNGDIFYDVGSNYGFFSQLACEIINNGECHAFEPDADTFAYLEKNLYDSNEKTKVFLNNKALTNINGEVTFYSRKDFGASGTSTTSEEAVSLRGRNYSVEKVPSLTLDEYVKTHNPPSMIKIDIEGGEYNMLLGAKEVLLQYKPTIVLEVSGFEEGEKLSQKAINFLIENGYSANRLSSDGKISLVNAIDTQRLIYSYENFIFIKN